MAKRGVRESGVFNIEIRNLGPLQNRLKRQMPEVFENALFAGIEGATIHLQSAIKNLLEGPVLERRTGRLWRSVQPETFKRGGTVVGIVGTDVEYAPVHEFGATIRPRRRGGVLVFTQGGETIFARKVEIPRRPYFSRAFLEEKDKATDIIRDVVLRHARAAFYGEGETNVNLPPSLRTGVAPSMNQFEILPRTRL